MEKVVQIRDAALVSFPEEREFSRRLYDSIFQGFNPEGKRFRCSGPRKDIARAILKDMKWQDDRIDAFLSDPDGPGSCCCDCEIGFNLAGGDDSGLEIHHDYHAVADD